MSISEVVAWLALAGAIFGWWRCDGAFREIADRLDALEKHAGDDADDVEDAA